jgi:ABC-2 type transport system permease protein
MQKILLICAHEWRLQYRKKLAIMLLPVFQILLLASLFNGWSYTQNLDEYQTQFQETVEQQWQSQPDRHPHRVAHFGTYGFRPANTLSLFDSGVNYLVGNSLFLEAHRQNASQFSESQSGGNIVGFIPLSTANLLLILWPLLLIVLAQDSMNQEIRSKRLALLQTTGVNLFQLLIAKALAYFCLSFLFLLPAFVVTAILAGFLPAQSDQDLFLRLFILFITYLIYSLWWIIFILIVSTLVKSNITNLSVLIASWLLICFLVPKTLSNAAYLQVNTPSQAVFEKILTAESEKLGNSHNPNDPYFSKFKEETLKKYQKSSIEELPVNYAGLVMAEGEKLTSKVFKEHYQQLLNQYQQQKRWLAAGYALSPYLWIKEWSMKISATDSRHFFEFERQAESFRYELIQELNHLHTEQINYKDNKTQRLDKHVWQTLPQFRYQPPDISWSLESNFIEKIMGCWWLLILVVGLLGIKRKGSHYATL